MLWTMGTIAGLSGCVGSYVETTHEWVSSQVSVGVSGEPVGPSSLIRVSGILEHQDLLKDGDSTVEVIESTREYGPWRPVLLNESGRRINPAPAPDPNLYEPYARDMSFSVGLQFYEGLAPGEYRIVSLEDLSAQVWDLDEPVVFQVEQMATDTGKVQVGDVFFVDGYQLSGAGSGLLGLYSDAWLRVDARAGDQALVEVIVERAQRCVALRAWTESEGGELYWRPEQLHFNEGESELVLRGMDMRLPLSQDGQQILGGQLLFTLEADGVDAFFPEIEGGICEQLEAAGLPCGDCTQSIGQCRTIFVGDITASKLPQREAAELGQDLPLCGVDASDPLEPVLDLSMLDLSLLSLDCGCTTAAGFSSASLGWLALALVRFRRRKRRGEGGETGKE